MKVTTERQLLIQFKYSIDHQELVSGVYSASSKTPWHIDYMNLSSTLTLYFLDADDSEAFAWQLKAPGKQPLSFLGMTYDTQTQTWLDSSVDGGPDFDEILGKAAAYFGIPEFAVSGLLDIAVHRCVDEVDRYVVRTEAMTLYLDEEIEYGRFEETESLNEELGRSLCIWKMPYDNTINVAQHADGSFEAEELYEGNVYEEQIGLYVLTV